jgi:DNA repair protein RadA/Sms
MRVDDPACDLAIAAALTSAATATAPPERAAFVGEVALTGLVRPAPAMAQRLAAARAAGCRVLFAPEGPPTPLEGVRVVPVRHVGDALRWALPPVETRLTDRSA